MVENRWKTVGKTNTPTDFGNGFFFGMAGGYPYSIRALMARWQTADGRLRRGQDANAPVSLRFTASPPSAQVGVME